MIPSALDLYSQFKGTGAEAQGGPGTSSPRWTKYAGSIPFTTTTPVFGPRPPPASVPFWDVPPTTLDPAEGLTSPWDTVFFGGQKFPGLARVKSKKQKRIDVKKKKGDSSATMTFVGYGPAEIDVSLSIWTQGQFDSLQALMPIILPKPARPGVVTNFSPIDIVYPSLVLMNIRSIIIVSVDALEPSTPKGIWAMKITCLEYYQPTKTDQTTTARGSSTFTANAAIKSGPQDQSKNLTPNSTKELGPKG